MPRIASVPIACLAWSIANRAGTSVHRGTDMKPGDYIYRRKPNEEVPTAYIYRGRTSDGKVIVTRTSDNDTRIIGTTFWFDSDGKPIKWWDVKE